MLGEEVWRSSTCGKRNENRRFREMHLIIMLHHSVSMVSVPIESDEAEVEGPSLMSVFSML